MQAHLVIVIRDRSDALIKRVTLPEGWIWTIGSSPVSDVVLESASDIYPEHGCLLVEEGELYVKNVSMLGKVYLNDEQISYRPIGANDVIGIGPYRISVEGLEVMKAVSEPEVPSEEPEVVMEIPEAIPEAPAQPPSLEPPAIIHEEKAGGPPEEKTMVIGLTEAKLVWFSQQGEKIFLLTEGKYGVGSGSEATVRIADERLASNHFQIEEREGAYYLHDAGSPLGTRVNGIRVADIMLHDEDEIEAGDSLFKMVIGLKEGLRAITPPEKKTQVVEFLPPKAPPPKPPKWYQVRRNQLLILAGCVGLLLLILWLEPETEPVATAPKPLSPTPVPVLAPKDPWELLTKDQQQEIEKMYEKAQALMARRAWEEAYALLRKIKDYGITYRDTEALLKKAQEEIVALEKKLYEEEQQDIEKERLATIDQYLRQGKVHLEKGMHEQAREMFSNVLELDPLNEEALRGLEASRSKKETLTSEIEQRRIQAENEDSVRAYYGRVMAALRSHAFDEARQLIRNRSKVMPYTTAIWDKRFKQAEQMIEEQKLAFYRPKLAQAQRYLSEEQWFEAWQICHDIAVKDPSFLEALQCRSRADAVLHERSQKLYQDAIVAESLGNLTEAKEKWQQILRIAPPYDTYHQRATEKLQLY